MSAPTTTIPQTEQDTAGTAPVLVRGVDRCDRCSAQAFVRTSHSDNCDLLWCAHHFRDHESALKESGAVVDVDERHLINTSPSVSANKD